MMRRAGSGPGGGGKAEPRYSSRWPGPPRPSWTSMTEAAVGSMRKLEEGASRAQMCRAWFENGVSPGFLDFRFF